jgi:hypothetical protein
MKKLLLTGIAALFLWQPGAAHASNLIEMPKPLHGDWCWMEGGDGSDWKQQPLFRKPPGKGCKGGNITVDKSGWDSEGYFCRSDKIEQIGTNTWQINVICDPGDKDTDEDDHAIAMFELIDNNLTITWLSES